MIASYTYGDVATIVDIPTNRSENPYQVYEIEHNHDTSGFLGRYEYQYDAVGNRESTTITTPDGLGGTDSIDYSYNYDNAYRLTSESYNTGVGNVTTQYQYDRAGNRTRTTNPLGEVTTYTYNANDELTRIDKPDYYFEDYTYDARGNLTQVEAGGHGTYSATNYDYNARDQLVSFGIGGTPIITYDYDHADNRIAQTISGTPTYYLWDEFSQYGDVILETGDNAGSLYRKMDYTLMNGMLISQTNVSDDAHYFLQDAQNSTIGLADDTGAVTSSYTYDAFGNLSDTASIETSYLYTGQQFDPIYTELYNLRARQYDPSNGRFLSRDTWAYDYENPVELNRYVYTANNPVNYTDPSGHSILQQLGQILKSVGTVAVNGLRWLGQTFGDDFVLGGIMGIAGYGLAKYILLRYEYGEHNDIPPDELYNWGIGVDLVWNFFIGGAIGVTGSRELFGGLVAANTVYAFATNSIAFFGQLLRQELRGKYPFLDAAFDTFYETMIDTILGIIAAGVTAAIGAGIIDAIPNKFVRTGVGLFFNTLIAGASIAVDDLVNYDNSTIRG